MTTLTAIARSALPTGLDELVARFGREVVAEAALAKLQAELLKTLNVHFKAGAPEAALGGMAASWQPTPKADKAREKLLVKMQSEIAKLPSALRDSVLKELTQRSRPSVD